MVKETTRRILITLVRIVRSESHFTPRKCHAFGIKSFKGDYLIHCAYAFASPIDASQGSPTFTDGNRACPYHAQLWRASKAPVRPHGGHGFSRVSQHAARGVPRGIDSHTRVPTPPIEPDREPDEAVAEPQSTQPPGGARCSPRTRSHPRSRFALIPRPSPWRALTQSSNRSQHLQSSDGTHAIATK